MTTENPKPDEPDIDSPALLRLADRVLDGTPIDWNSIDSSEPTCDDVLLRQFRVLAEVTLLHRSLASSGVDTDPGTAAPEGAFPTNSDRLEQWGSLTRLERIGEGAFGEVFRAWDSRLDREVALKLLRQVPDQGAEASDLSVEEGRLLARVRHPNVITVYGAERIDGSVGIWTEFIRGRTLSQLVREAGRFGPHEAAAIGIDLCRALSAVHRAGLLHRDIKPQNVMREEGGRIVLMDFGAGKERLERALSRTDELTGTPLFLAPELWEGTEATPQSDVYGLGVLLYYLVTGEYPVRGKTMAEVRSAHRTGNRVLLRDERPELPEGFVDAIERALAADPARRFPTSGAFEVALQKARAPEIADDKLPASAHPRLRWRHALAAAAVALAIGVGAVWWSRGPASRPVVALSERPWVLVARFENGTGDPLFDGTAQYGVERELANSQFVRLAPIQRIDDVLRLMKMPVDTPLDLSVAREVAIRDGEIGAVVTGRIDRLGSGYLLAASIMTPQDGALRAAVTEQADSQADVVGAFRRLSNSLRERLGETTTAIRQGNVQLERVTTPSLKALQSYMRASEEGNRGRWEASAELARQAVTEDPQFASAWIWLAWALHNRYRVPEALEAARRAVSLAGGVSDWERFWIEGSAHSMTGETDKAMAEYQSLLALRPDHAWAVNNLLVIPDLAGIGRSDVQQHASKLAELLPNQPYAQVLAADARMAAGAAPAEVRSYWEKAVALLELGAEVRPYSRAWVALFPAYARLTEADLRGATAELDRAFNDPTAGTDDTRRSVIPAGFMMHLAMGQVDAARSRLAHLRSPSTRELLLGVADFYAGSLASARAHFTRATFEPGDQRSSVALYAVAVWAMNRVGLFERAEAEFNAIEPGLQPTRYGSRAVRGDLALARGVTDGAISLLLEALPHLQYVTGGDYLRASLALSDAFVRKGQFAKAADSLQSALQLYRAKSVTRADAELAGVTSRARLAALCRRVGRQQEADLLDAELTQRLALADPAFVRRLREIAEAGLK